MWTSQNSIGTQQTPHHSESQHDAGLVSASRYLTFTVAPIVVLMAAKRNPNWTKDELLLALDLYLRVGLAGDSHPEVIKLSNLLRSLAFHPPNERTQTFRNPNGVARKLANLANFDPNYSGKPTHGSALDWEVYSSWASFPNAINEAVIAITEGDQDIAVPKASSGEIGGVYPAKTNQIERQIFINPHYANSEEWTKVIELADSLLAYMNLPSTLQRFNEANQPGISSAVVQDVILPHLDTLGFTSEAQGLFDNYPTKGLRPDYFRAINQTGIIVEVERGKTTTNNMDLLDFWKCHICEQANYLFLLVPQALKHNVKQATPKKEYTTVKNRLSAFFLTGNYTNVNGLVLFGY